MSGFTNEAFLERAFRLMETSGIVFPENLLRFDCKLNGFIAEAHEVQIANADTMPPHDCRNVEESEITIPPFLVVPIKSVQNVNTMDDCTSEPSNFAPYVVTGAVMTHKQKAPTARTKFRLATELEIVCGFAQYKRSGCLRTRSKCPEVGSYHFWNDTDFVEATMWSNYVKSGERQQMVQIHRANDLFMGQSHHLLYIPVSGVDPATAEYGLTYNKDTCGMAVKLKARASR